MDLEETTQASETIIDTINEMKNPHVILTDKDGRPLEVQDVSTDYTENLENNKNTDNITSSFMIKIAEKSKLKSIQLKKDKEQKHKQFLLERQEREDNIMENLTNLYYHKIIENLEQASEIGSFKMVMNFDYSKFYANFPTLGTPIQVAIRWSNYLTLKQNEEKIRTYINDFNSLQGLKFYVKANPKISKMIIYYHWNNIS